MSRTTPLFCPRPRIARKRNGLSWKSGRLFSKDAEVRFPVGNEGSLVAYNMAALLDPQSIAIIGASADLDRIGGLPIKLLTEARFERVFAVNPKYDRIASYPCYKSIEDVPEPVDLVVLATGAKDSLDLLRRSHAKGARAAIIFASGFAETGEPETVALQV